MYTEVSSARKSTSWRPSTTFRERQSVAAQGGLQGDKNQSGEEIQNGHLEHAEGEKTPEALV